MLAINSIGAYAYRHFWAYFKNRT